MHRFLLLESVAQLRVAQSVLHRSAPSYECILLDVGRSIQKQESLQPLRERAIFPGLHQLRLLHARFQDVLLELSRIVLLHLDKPAKYPYPVP